MAKKKKRLAVPPEPVMAEWPNGQGITITSGDVRIRVFYQNGGCVKLTKESSAPLGFRYAFYAFVNFGPPRKMAMDALVSWQNFRHHWREVQE